MSGRGAAHRLALERTVPPVAGDSPAAMCSKGGLAASGRADQGNDFSLADAEGDIPAGRLTVRVESLAEFCR